MMGAVTLPVEQHEKVNYHLDKLTDVKKNCLSREKVYFIHCKMKI